MKGSERATANDVLCQSQFGPALHFSVAIEAKIMHCELSLGSLRKSSLSRLQPRSGGM